MRANFQLLFILVCLSCTLPVAAQYNWVATPIPNAISRYDDMAWRSPGLGYAIDFNGYLRKTADGGQNWQTLPGPEGKYYRSMAFLTDQKGFIGKLQPSLTTAADTFTLYRTLDAGQTWVPVPIASVPASRQGFCGMSAVTDQVLYACGRYSGPAYVYKTTDGGTTWTSIDMSLYAAGLIDCYFWTPDSGIVVGHNGNPWNQGNSLILSTSDGGQTWQNRYTSVRTQELCWKISFPSASTGYVSVFSEAGTGINVLKTTNKGQSWQDLNVGPGSYYAEGIGFLNDSTGWLGGGVSNLVYFTNNSGQTWTLQPVGSLLNRFQFFGDTLAYASGQKVYKLDLGITILPDLLVQQRHLNQLMPPVPNPAPGKALISLDMRSAGPARLVLVNMLGQEVKQVYSQAQQPAGVMQLEVSLVDLAPGMYLLQLQTNQGAQSQRLVLGQ